MIKANKDSVRSSWSDELKSLSDHILNDMPMAPFAGGYCALKHISGSHARISLEDCLLREYKIYDMRTGKFVIEFDSVSDIIAAGWAVD